jgi:TnpA family transposase
MPRRCLLSSTEWSRLIAFPLEQSAFIQYYTLNEQDISVIKQHRGSHNRLGFAVQLCCLRYPGISLTFSDHLPGELLNFIAEQINASLAQIYRFVYKSVFLL